MAEKIRLGILGTGNMARAFALGLQHAPAVDLVAVASRTNESAEAFAGEFNTVRYFSDYRLLAAEPDIDLIYIATPHSCHMENSLMCLDAGKAVLCEKPFTINAAQARAVIESAREKGLFLMEAMWSRYIPAMVKLRELLSRKVIGDVQIMLAGGAFMPPFDPNAYLFRPDLGGGVLLDAGVYLVSIASMVLGTPNRILATGSLGPSGVDDHDAFILQHDNGAIASCYVSLRASASPEITLLGDRGKLQVHAPLFAPPRLTLSLSGKADEVMDFPFAGNGYQFEAQEAAECLLAGSLESSIMPLDETLTVMQTMDEIRQQFHLRYPMELQMGKN